MKKSYIQPSIVTILAVGGQILSGSINIGDKETDTPEQYSKKTISSPSWMMNLRTVGLKPLPFGISK